jgi:hypothetical protein
MGEVSMSVVPDGIVNVEPDCTAANPLTAQVLVLVFHVPFRVMSGPLRLHVEELSVTLDVAPAGNATTETPIVAAATAPRTSIETRRI